MIFLDMDGVLVNFIDAACKLHGEDPSGVDCWEFYKKWGLTDEQFWGPIDSQGAGWWSSLKLYPWADDLIDLVAEYDPEFRICTAPCWEPECAAGKLAWIKKRFGRDFTRFHLTPSKSDLSAYGRVLIDDSESNCNDFTINGGDAILFPQPWNRMGTLDESRLRYMETCLEVYCT